MPYNPNDYGSSPFAPPRSGYSETAHPYPLTHRKHSVLGIISLVISVFVGITTFGMIAFAAIKEAGNPGGLDEQSTSTIFLGLGIISMIGLSVLGLGLAIGGFFQSNRQKLFPILGLVFNGAIVVGVIGLIVLGLSVG